ncbi:MAG: DUF6036 family nucleotidyltransferase [Candidatus Limnocylindrales bacterium]
MTAFGRAQLDAALHALGELLAVRGLHYELVVIGGGNLILRGLVARPTTKDLDLLGARTSSGVEPMRPMPEPLRRAVLDVARTYGLADDWINLGPESLLDFGLPAGFTNRLERRDYDGLIAWLAGRFDMVCFKLFAAVDQGPRSRHLQDLGDLEPDPGELLAAARWTLTHDPSPGYRLVLVEMLRTLGMEDADGRLD